MTNRLRKLLRHISCTVWFCLSGFLAAHQADAQSSFFNFNYNGPDTLAVGPNCNLPLQGNIPNPIVTSTVGATIITSVFDQASSGFAFNDPFAADEVAHIYWFVEDNAGHSFTFEFFIHFVDATPPVFNLTGVPDTLYFASVVQVPIMPPNIPILDNCSAFTLNFVESPRPDTCLAGFFTRTWTATDIAGNVSTFTQTVIIAADITPPTISFPPQNGGAACELLATAYPAWLAAQMAAFSVQDPSGIKSKTNNGPASFPPGCTVPLTVVFRATDNCNLMISTTAVFSTSDNEGPVVLQEPVDTIAYCSPGGNHLTKLNEWIHNHAFMQVIDSCSGPVTYTMQVNGSNADSAAVVAAFNTSFVNPCGTQLVGSQVVADVSASVRVDFFVTDACGNLTFAGQATFAAVDTLPPVITGVNTTEQCGGGNDQANLQAWINAKGNATLSDDCSTALWTSFSYSSSDGQTGSGTFNAGPYPLVAANNCSWFTDVTFAASDECGNASSKTLRFQIIDNQPPVFTGLVPNITVHCPNPLPTVPAATVTDNCDAAVSITFTRVYQDTICDGSYTVVTTWRATDDCNNTSTAVQNIFVRDTTKPVFSLIPAGFTARCDTFALPPVPVMGIQINATDVCSPVVSITTNTISVQNPNPAVCGHYAYNILRTFTATDECGNTQTATQLISVIDNLPPVPGGVLDTTALCSNLTPFPAPAPTAADACSGNVIPVFVDTVTLAGNCAGQYTLQLNWTATDVCGNQAAFTQTVHVIDTVPPTLSNIPGDITVECNNIPPPPGVSGFNGVDNCSPTVMVTLFETELRNPDPAQCDHWHNWTLRREWTATDDCGNTRKHTQNIQIEDTTPPVLTPPDAQTLGTDPGDCGATIAIPAPLSILDNCTTLSSSVLLQDTITLTPVPNFPATLNVVVDTVVFNFNVPNTPPAAPATSPVNLTIYIDQADTEGTDEYFNIYGENGQYLDRTSQTVNQCDLAPSVKMITIPANKFNEWTQDGVLTITLAPNGLAGAAINAVCQNARARASVSYNFSTPEVPVDLTYSLDGGPEQAYPPAGTTFLPIGQHEIVYTATDCAGNSATASTTITVNDTEAPAMAMPAPITAYVGSGNCTSAVVLPFPSITENCQMSGHLVKSSAMLPLSFILDPNAGIVPADVPMTISGVIPNAVGNGLLTIRFKGDNGNSREFFDIFQGAGQLMTTNLGTIAGQCQDTIDTSLVVTAAQINNWAASGSAMFRAEPNINPGPSFDFDFINPCSPLLPDQTDGLSRIQAVLEYSYAIINFTITRNSNNMIVATGALQGTQTSVNLSPGTYTVKYTTTDLAGLMGMTSFPLVVRDTIDPQANCKPSHIIQVNPSGVNNYTLQPAEINNGSTDNCSGSNLTYSLSQTTFGCNQAGSNFNVVLTVTDTSGNSATCTTVVSVQNTPPMPAYDAVCEGDTLFLYSNPPMPGVFSYTWIGPSFTSVQQNPIRLNTLPSFQGLYTVVITGATGCTSSAGVTVNFASLNVPSITASGGIGTNFCTGQNVVLGTTTVPGPNVSYQWFQNTMPNPTLVATTTLPTLTIVQPPAGQYQYFVKVKIGQCLTPNSIVITFNVNPRPPATVVDDQIVICEGEPLSLGTTVSGTGILYNWNGPLEFSSSAQFPLVTNAATQGHAGIYTLCTAYQSTGCQSNPCATVEVIVKYTPPKPQILGNGHVCVGEDVSMLASLTGPTSMFQWQQPNLSILDTTLNSLLLPDVDASDCGNWRVRAWFETCESEWSDPFEVCPTPYPEISAGSNAPICSDSTLNLMASSNLPNLSWCWVLPNGTNIFQQNPTINPGIGGSYTVIAKNGAAQCADTATVQVNISIPPVIEFIEVNAPVCADDVSDACLIPQISGGNMPFTYFWSKQGTVISNNLTLCFPDVTPAQNGPYTFVVKDAQGCPSGSGSVTLNVQAEVSTPVMALLPNPACEGADITLSVTNSGAYSASSSFFWITPAGDTIETADPQLILPGIRLDQAGDYLLYVQEAVCYSDNSNAVKLMVNPIPAAPQISSNQPVCVGEALSLIATFNGSATYVWGGPNGFNSSLYNPVRNSSTVAFEGDYFVYILVNGCQSDTATTTVDIMQPPKNPLITPESPQPVCIDQLPLSGFLSVSLPTQTFGALYTWINPATGDTIAGPATSPILNFADLADSLITPGNRTFQVIAWKQDNPNGEGCSAMLSNVVNVRFDTIPDNFAQVASDHPACVSNAIPLVATHPSGGITGRWTQLSGPTIAIVNRDSSMAQFSGQAGNTYTFVWSLSSGGCKNFSTDTLEIEVVAPESANAGVDQFICDGSNVSLNAVQGQFSAGGWSQMGQIGVQFADATEPQTPISGLNPGNRYVFIWTLADIGCGAKSDTVSVFYYSVKPNISGSEFVCTGENKTNLSAQGIQLWESGQWTSATGNLTFTPPNSPSTLVSGLIPGMNTVYWTINNNVCGSNSRDTFVVNYEIYPTAVADTFDAAFGATLSFNVLNNDFLPLTPPDVSIITDPSNGSIIGNPSLGVFEYRPSTGFSGTDVFTYQICNVFCGPNACSNATVVIRVGAPGECVIPTIITPNADGLNDAFILPDECFINGEGPENVVEVVIFNQWGDKVFYQERYEKESGKGHWDGRFEGQELPVGTYFYYIRFNDAEPLSGWVLLQR